MDMDSRLLDRVGGIAGILFAVLIVAGVMVSNTPDSSAQPAKWVQYYSSSGHRAQVIVCGYLWVLAGVAVIVLVAVARKRFGNRSGASQVFATTAGIAAIIFSGILIVAGVAIASVAGNVAFGGANVPANGDLINELTGFGFALLVLGGGLTAAVALGSVSMVIVRDGGPRWLGVLGFVAAALCLVGVLFFPMIALPVWVLVASIALLARRSTDTVQAPTAAPAT